MLAQCKGKDLNKVPQSKLGNEFYASIKYDGHYCQIHKIGDEVKFYTSGGKEFYLENIAEELVNLNPLHDFIIEAEYIYTTSGKLGNRGKAARLTTYRTDFEKGIVNVASDKERFKVFDIITDKPMIFEDRLWELQKLNLGTHCELVDYLGPYDLSICKAIAKSKVKKGYEGLYLKAPSHIYRAGKRVNDAIKLKLRPTADLLCIDVEDGEGKYTGMIGSLVLKDSKGRVVRVGSGLSDIDRAIRKEAWIGAIIEIEYEQILDTYIQPTYVGIRNDKKEID